ncbi:MAG TPA: MATE family efflux transporter [Lacipirellulaceae bacterium]|nr:MATE family efflux transporter [Lacipirellulaceae bacterium]
MSSPPADHQTSLWNRPSGVREVLAIALPMVASTLSWTLMNFIDAMVLFHYVSPAAMSAQFSATIAWFSALSLFWGMCSYVSTFVSQYQGDGQPRRIGPAVWQGVWLSVLFAPIALAAIPLAPSIFHAVHDAKTAELEAQFFQIMCWAAPGMLAAQALEAFFSGQGRTLVVMAVDGAAVAVNLVLACFLVIGVGGVQSWGFQGAAWATVIAQWSRVAFYMAIMLSAANRRQFNTAQAAIDLQLLRRIVRFGGPSGVQMLLEVGSFAVFVMLVGRIGAVEREATSLVFRISQLAFMPVWGFGIATVVLVGQRLGENRPDLASRAARTTFAIALTYMGLLSLLFVLAPGVFLRWFASAELAAAEEALAVRELSLVLMRFVAAYNLFDATLIIFSSVLRGAGDTKFIMRLSTVSAGVLIAATSAAVELLGVGIHGCWAIITVWIWLLAAAYIVRYRQGQWRSMRVIDQTHHGAAATPAGPYPGELAPAVVRE